jgi:FkbM family methyltransferase
MEAMPFTWMYQQINLWMNLPAEYMMSGRLVSALAAIGGRDGERLTMQFRDDSLTSTRNWNPDIERSRTLCNVSVELVTLSALLRRTHLDKKIISWFKLDCEGCEYDLVPLMSDAAWDGIKSMSGELHFDDIAHWNPKFLPPKDKVAITHRRVCKFMTKIRECQPHYNYESKYLMH